MDDNKNDKKNKEKSLFQVAREMEEKANQDMMAQVAEKEKKQKIEYEKKIRQEKIELIRMKQGEIEESELIHEEAPTVVKMSFFKKISNFLYHSKWWLGIATFIVVLAVILVHDIVTKEHPDITVIYLDENNEVGNSEGLQNYIAQFCDDFNNDGEVVVSVYYIPYTGNENADYSTGVTTKLVAEMQSAEAMIIFGNEKTGDAISPEATLADLQELYPNNSRISEYAFKLNNTDFAEKIECSSALNKELFVGIRRVQKLQWADVDEMQAEYDKSKIVLDRIIEDLSK